LSKLLFRSAEINDNDQTEGISVRRELDDSDREFLKAVEDGKKHQEKMFQDTMKSGGYGLKAIAKASRDASTWAENDGLHPVMDLDTRDWKYTIKQGLRAACVGREDAAANLILQGTILDNQKSIIRLLWIAIALLAYIAYRLS
jgi:hypothetical protein